MIPMESIGKMAEEIIARTLNMLWADQGLLGSYKETVVCFILSTTGLTRPAHQGRQVTPLINWLYQ